MKNGGKNKSVAFIILFSVYISKKENMFDLEDQQIYFLLDLFLFEREPFAVAHSSCDALKSVELDYL